MLFRESKIPHFPSLCFATGAPFVSESLMPRLDSDATRYNHKSYRGRIWPWTANAAVATIGSVSTDFQSSRPNSAFRRFSNVRPRSVILVRRVLRAIPSSSLA